MSRYLGGLGGVACLGAWGPVRPTQVANVDAKSDIFLCCETSTGNVRVLIICLFMYVGVGGLCTNLV